jgi:hypothetical protein
MDAIRDAIYDVLASDHPQTDRQVFYQIASRLRLVPKEESEYKGTICRLLTVMRRKRIIPFEWITDSTRWMRKPRSYSSLAAMLASEQQFYRRALWNDQDVYLEVWIEKDALAGVLFDITAEYDVPLMVTKGYPSLSYLYSAAQTIADQEKPTYIYFFGDWDPSGKDISRATEAGLREFAPDAEIHFERVAVLEEQIRVWDLPTRPTKKSDSRSKNFDGDSVELDAIPAGTLRQLVQTCIER